MGLSTCLDHLYYLIASTCPGAVQASCQPSLSRQCVGTVCLEEALQGTEWQGWWCGWMWGWRGRPGLSHLPLQSCLSGAGSGVWRRWTVKPVLAAGLGCAALTNFSKRGHLKFLPSPVSIQKLCHISHLGVFVCRNIYFLAPVSEVQIIPDL